MNRRHCSVWNAEQGWKVIFRKRQTEEQRNMIHSMWRDMIWGEPGYFGDIDERKVYKMKYCGKCGYELYADDEVCPNCGAPNTAYVSKVHSNYTYRNTSNSNGNMSRGDGWDYTPISMWGYFGYQILFWIPLIGIILLLVFALGGTRNINLRNFARSYFCIIIVLAILMFLITISVMFWSVWHLKYEY